MRNQIRKESLKATVVLFACSGSGNHLLFRHVAAFSPSPPSSCRDHSCFNAAVSTRSKTGYPRHCRRRHSMALGAVGTKRPRPVDIVASQTGGELHVADQATTKPKITFGLLPDFMQKDPLLVTKQKWMEKSSDTDNIEEESAASKRRDNEMMAMSVFSIALAIGVVYALASSSPEMVEQTKESENVVRDMMREGNVERLELATRNIVGTVLPNSAEDVIAVSIGEGIAGVIGACATWLLGVVLNFKSDEAFMVTQVDGAMEDNVDAFVSEAVADGDYFLTRAAAEPLLEALGIPIFFASLASVLIATLPYEAVKLTSQKRRNVMAEEDLLNKLLEEEEQRKRDRTVVDDVSNNIFEFISRLNVRANTEDDLESELLDASEVLEEQQPNVASLDYVELFADITKWLEYDVLITNYRGILALPNGQMLSAGWESAIFGLLCALSSQLYTDVLYLYSDFGNPIKREKTLTRSVEGWASLYTTKCLSAATLFGVYEAVRTPTSQFISQLVSGGVAGCSGSNNFDLCMETYLVNNPPSASIEADFRAFAVSAMNWADNFSWLLPLNDQESFASFARGLAVSLYSVLDRVFNM
ncbi:hypothetical protein ACHAXR_006365 [Thalassiosira sp. AJA248-18]